MPDIPSPCPCCGGLTLLPDAYVPVLLGVCDLLTLQALEAMGKRIVRAERSRFRALGGRPMHVAHTLWPPDEIVVRKAMRSAWDLVPYVMVDHGCCGVTPRQVTDMLDEYVADLIITGTEHTSAELRYRFTDRLGIPLPAGKGDAASAPLTAQARA